MKSSRAKVLHEVAAVPMIHHVVESLLPLHLVETVVVTGHQADKVEAALADFRVSFARQQEQLGTAHAVLAASNSFENFDGTVMILCGDTPLIRSVTLQNMLNEHIKTGSALTVMSTILSDPTNYGRILTGPDNEVVGIVEEKDASLAEKGIKEINAGVYCVESGFLRKGLEKVSNDNKQNEYYLTDLVSIAIEDGYTVNRWLCGDPGEVLGVNSQLELAVAGSAMEGRIQTP